MVEERRTSPSLETLLSREEIRDYVLTVCQIKSPIIIFNAKGDDIVDRFGEAMRCFSSLQEEPAATAAQKTHKDRTDLDGGSPLPLQFATKCLDTVHLSEFLVRFLASTKEYDYTMCRAISRHDVGKFTDKSSAVIGYYLGGPVTQLEGETRNCPLTTQSCPFALSSRQIGLLETQLASLRGFISGAYQTNARRLARENPSLWTTTPANGPAPKTLNLDKRVEELRAEIDQIYHKVFPHQVFVCYAQRDNEGDDPRARWLDRLLEHLGPLKLEGRLSTWSSDPRIQIGEPWRKKIESALASARAAILLVSPAFLDSDFIRSDELPVLLWKAKTKGTEILPIILRPCRFEETKFKYPDPRVGPDELSLADLQAANSPSAAMNGLSENAQDKVLVSIANRVESICRCPGGR